jgi:hypothetical protein
MIEHGWVGRLSVCLSVCLVGVGVDVGGEDAYSIFFFFFFFYNTPIPSPLPYTPPPLCRQTDGQTHRFIPMIFTAPALGNYYTYQLKT